MLAELPSPVDYNSRMSELVLKAKRLDSLAIDRSGKPNELGVSRYIDDPRQLEQRIFRRDAVLFDILVLRAEEIASVVNHRMFGDIPRTRPYSQFDTDVELRDRPSTSYNHELSQHEVDIFVGPEVFHSSVDAIARSKGLTSLDILRLIGEPDHGISREDSAPQSLRFIKEIIAAQEHAKRHPQFRERMSEIVHNLAKKLIHLRQTKPGNPLLIGMQRLDDDENGLIVFASKPKYDRSYGPVRILDKDGQLNKGVATVPADQELEQLARDIKGDHWGEVDGYDFWVIRKDDGTQSIYWNQGRMPYDYPDPDQRVA